MKEVEDLLAALRAEVEPILKEAAALYGKAIPDTPSHSRQARCLQDAIMDDFGPILRLGTEKAMEWNGKQDTVSDFLAAHRTYQLLVRAEKIKVLAEMGIPVKESP